MAGEIVDYSYDNNTDVYVRDNQGRRQRAELVAIGGYTNPRRLSAFQDLSVSQFEPLTGWTFAYNINPELIETVTANGGTVTQHQSSAVLESGTDPAGKAYIETVRGSRYIPGIGALARFTCVFGTPQENSIQIVGIGNGTDGWFFGYNGTSFGVLRRDGGVDNWTYQEDWNIDNRNDLDPQKGNIYEIRYQWLGYGMQYFSVEDTEGNITNVHNIQYANNFTETSNNNPNLPLSALVENLGNTTTISLSTPSAIAGLEGYALNDTITVNQADDFEGDVAPGSQVPILAFRLGDTYQGKSNRLFAQALRLTFATEGAKPVVFRFYVGGTVTGGTWSYIDEAASPLESNKTITSYTPGNKIGTFGLGKADSYPVDLTESAFRLYSGQQIVVTASTTSTANEVVFGFNWKVFV